MCCYIPSWADTDVQPRTVDMYDVVDLLVEDSILYGLVAACSAETQEQANWKELQEGEKSTYWLIVAKKNSQADESIAEDAPYLDDCDIDILPVVLEVIDDSGSARLWDYGNSWSIGGYVMYV